MSLSMVPPAIGSRVRVRNASLLACGLSGVAALAVIGFGGFAQVASARRMAILVCSAFSS